jgi:hypothetical protein
MVLTIGVSMIDSRKCNLYYNENASNFLVQYKDNFKEQIDKILYACGDIITDTLAVVAVSHAEIPRLLKDVPEIVFYDFKSMYVLGETSTSTPPTGETSKLLKSKNANEQIAKFVF